MSAAHLIDPLIVNKITLMAYKLNPHPLATLITECVEEANEDFTMELEDYLSNYYEPCDEDGNTDGDEVDESNYYLDAERDDGIIYDVEYIADNQYEDYKEEILEMPLYDKMGLRRPLARRMKPYIC